MNLAELQARRATLDDLPALRALWHGGGLAPGGLEKQLRDLQVVQDRSGGLVGAAAFQIHSSQAWLHDETYVSDAVEAAARPLLLERMRVIARNHGLHRIWVRSFATAWVSHGFVTADASSLEKLPAAFGTAADGWHVLKLREETPESLSLEHELALFVQAQKAGSEQWRRQAQWIKNGAYLLLTLVILLGTVLFAISLFPTARWRSYLRGGRTAQPWPSDVAATNRPPADGTQTR